MLLSISCNKTWITPSSILLCCDYRKENTELTPKQEISEKVDFQRTKSGHVRSISKGSDFEEISKMEGGIQNCWGKPPVEGLKEEFPQKTQFRPVTVAGVRTSKEERGPELSAAEEGCMQMWILTKTAGHLQGESPPEYVMWRKLAANCGPP